mmetsp:Transcript_2839/g.10307  ORF Transcript_2839/g.10307 Transcript_2839/m.10307 type:complete len:204 (-) Transcript_2839:163-774(-)
MYVIIRIVVRHDRRFGVGDIARVNFNRLPGVRAFARRKRRHQFPASNILKPSRILTTHGVTFKIHRCFISQLHTFDVNRIPRNRNPVPPASHRSVWRPPALSQPEPLHLIRRRRHRRLLKYRLQPLPGRYDVTQHLILGIIAILRPQVKPLPRARVHVRLDPLGQNQIHHIRRHLLPRHVHHGRARDLPTLTRVMRRATRARV